MKELIAEWIRNYVSPAPKRLVEGNEEVTVLPGSDQSLIWIPKRQSLKHAVFSLPEQLKGRKLTSALDLKVRAWAPFTSLGYATLWNDNQASVIAWDYAAIEQRIVQQGYQPAKCKIVPEVFMREPGANGIRLMEVNDGIEAQVWKDGFLSMTRWWSDTPSQGEWSLFARSSGVTQIESGSVESQISFPEWLETPWNSAIRNSDLLGQVVMNRRVMSATATILLIPCIYFSSEWLALTLLNASMKTEISTLEKGSQSVRNNRARAISALEHAESLAALEKFPRQIEIISRTHNLLLPFDLQISGWDYADGILEFGLKSETTMNGTLYIPPFENDPMFSRVSASTRGQRLVMRMDVTKARDLP